MVKKTNKKTATKKVKKTTQKVVTKKTPTKASSKVQKTKKVTIAKKVETPKVEPKIKSKPSKKEPLLPITVESKFKCVKCNNPIDKFVAPFEGKFEGLRIFKCASCGTAVVAKYASTTMNVESIDYFVPFIQRLKNNKTAFLSKIEKIKDAISKETDSEKLSLLKKQLKKESDLSSVVDNEIDLWHDTENSLLLHEFLGLEYPQWKLFAGRKKCIEEFAELPIPEDFVPAEDDKPIKNKKGAKLDEDEEVEDFVEEATDEDDEF